MTAYPDPVAFRPTPGGDIVIVGGGLAGLFCALKLAPRPVTVLTAAPIGEGASSAWAQGGIAASVSEGDTPEAHAADTVAAGAGIVDPDIAAMMAREAPERIEDLLRYGVPFDRDLAGRLMLSREAAHSQRRIVRVKGDMAGRAIMAALVAAVGHAASVRVLAGYAAERLVAVDGRVTGLVVRPAGGDGAPAVLPARAVVLATGGVGHLYALTTNPAEASGQGLAMAAAAGAVVADCEFVQFHPTAIAVGRDPAPLATEALRGDGAVLVNRTGVRFMAAAHPLAELAPRDVVARAIQHEIAAGRGAFLDCRAAIGAAFADKYPTVHASCIEAGIDPARDLVPVSPAAHYHMGGVRTDARGRTSLAGLWACGEVASTGAHGANRLASNSLLEAVVFAARIAADIDGLAPPAASVPDEQDIEPGAGIAPAREAGTAVARLRAAMSAQAGVERTGGGLVAALRAIAELRRATHEPRLGNMLTAAGLIVAAALKRTESRGSHFRADHPQADPAQARRSFMTLAEAEAIATAALAGAPVPAAVEGPPQ